MWLQMEGHLKLEGKLIVDIGYVVTLNVEKQENQVSCKSFKYIFESSAVYIHI